MKKKNKKNDRQTNIDNTIKSILLSNREINHKNLKFNMLKQILLSDKKNELFNKKTFDFRNLIYHYKDQIDKEEELESASFYFNQLEEIRIKRVNEIIENGMSKNITINKMKNLNRDEEIEENWIDRGYTHINLTNGFIEVKIEDLTQLEYQVKLLKLETINNIVTSTFSLEKTELEKWLFELKDYSIKTYNTKPIVQRNVIFVGQNTSQLEKIFVYFCITTGKIYIIKRIKYF